MTWFHTRSNESGRGVEIALRRHRRFANAAAGGAGRWVATSTKLWGQLRKSDGGLGTDRVDV